MSPVSNIGKYKNIAEAYSGSVCKAGLQDMHAIKTTSVEKFVQLKQNSL